MSTIKINYRKTKRGQIGKIVEEVYLRRDVSCGYKGCSICSEFGNEEQNDVLLLEGQDEKCVYILDEKIAEIDRKMHVFANEFFEDTYVEYREDETTEQRNIRAVLNAAKWYTSHLGSIDVQCKFITNSHTEAEYAKQQGINAITIFDFVEEVQDQYPNLVDFLGFTQEGFDMEIEGQEENNIFEPHLPIEKINEEVRKGNLFQDKMFLDRTNTSEGKIRVKKFDFEIMIIGKQNLNRCLSGDIVAVQILPESEWVQQIELGNIIEEDEQDYQQNENQLEGIKEQKNEELRKLVTKIQEQKLVPTGKVVGITKRIQRNFYGHITQDIIKQFPNGIQIREFISTNQIFPNFYLKTKNAQNLEGNKITISFNSWPEYSPCPIGHFKSIIGKIGDTRTEGDLILLEHQVEYKTFSKKVLDCLPSKGEKWEIPPEEEATRLDLRNELICSIDPPGCKDIDDALHCKKLPNGNYQVGVHIADVTYFVRPETAIDKEAANRCTTVYLVDRRTDMLPKLLTETLCSLVSGVDRLAFSCIWELDQNANIVNVSFHKSIIHSKASLTYEMAQNIIDGNTKLEYQGKMTEFAFLKDAITSLQKLAYKLQQKRIDKGALQLASTQVKFTFDQETNNPTDVTFYKSFSTNSLVEEFMLLANVSVADKIVTHFPSISILRKHSQPKPKEIKQLQQIMEKLGFEFDYSSNKNLADTLNKINRQNDSFFNKTVRILTTRTMNEATYFCTAEADYPEFYHYGLAANLYTHFTSPIRRYADVLVHRLLAAAIDLYSLPSNMSNKLKMNRLCDQMNLRNRNARFASRASSDYNTFLFFKDKGDVEAKGIVTSITKQGVIILIEQFGFEGQMKYAQQDQELNSQLFKEQKQDLIVEFYVNGKKKKLFDYINVKVIIFFNKIQYNIKIKFINALRQFPINLHHFHINQRLFLFPSLPLLQFQ
ncbi:Nucleic acid-binding, OB-fold [Pseudocohnilembus persalinus]|uniref:Nucleic acid-binding, OB-fold n=1 Tax=Pseudocohnilembus persalinus TaxID=266149 RepID=A0A0V0QW14_PSEPJ|nr:Nucleic acid-binding, OB-fold [Pseudocohnilembus persalinus]|eukprot:KRX06611.1 Nucleic acid-binding, OB-fold [Pseudocohnilembus persalinus]